MWTGEERVTLGRPWWETPARSPLGFRPAPGRRPPWPKRWGRRNRSCREPRMTGHILTQSGYYIHGPYGYDVHYPRILPTGCAARHGAPRPPGDPKTSIGHATLDGR